MGRWHAGIDRNSDTLEVPSALGLRNTAIEKTDNKYWYCKQRSPDRFYRYHGLYCARMCAVAVVPTAHLFPLSFLPDLPDNGTGDRHTETINLV
jgi:hypothetical protein